MFGYVIADRSSLSDPHLQRYRSCYCGLCRQIGKSYGTCSRLALNYDLTFLVLLLSSLYEPEETCICQSCLIHPLRPHSCFYNEYTDYGGSMNVLLAHYSALDHWADDRNLYALLFASFSRQGARKVMERYPRQWTAVRQCLEVLAAMEADNLQEPDPGSNIFGNMMAELFAIRDDRWAPLLRQIGSSLGRFIYLLDAILDLPKDLKKNRYNPLRSRANDTDIAMHFLPILTMYMGECTDAFEQLPLLQDIEILRNILYSGVWSCFNRVYGKEDTYDR